MYLTYMYLLLQVSVTIKHILQVHPYGQEDSKDAYYSRDDKALVFGYEKQVGTVYTCRAVDIVAHLTGHALLDGLQPKWKSVEAGGICSR